MKNKIEIIKGSARSNRIKTTTIKFKCANKRKYTLVTAQIIGLVTTTYAKKTFMSTIPVPLLVNEVFTTKAMHFNVFLPYNLPPTISTTYVSISYFVVVKVFDGTAELASIQGEFKLFSNSYQYNFKDTYILNQECCRVGLYTCEELILSKIRKIFNKNSELDITCNDKSDTSVQENCSKNSDPDCVLNMVEGLRISEEESRLLNYKIAKINELGIVNEINKLTNTKKGKPNLMLLFDKEQLEEQLDIKLLISDNLSKLAEIKMKKFSYKNEQSVIFIKLHKKTKKIRAVLKTREEIEYSSMESRLFEFEKHNLDYLVHINLYLPEIKKFTFDSDMFKISHCLELRFDSYRCKIPVVVRQKNSFC